MGGCVARMEEMYMQGVGEEAWGKETTWKTYALMGGSGADPGFVGPEVFTIFGALFKKK